MNSIPAVIVVSLPTSSVTYAPSDSSKPPARAAFVPLEAHRKSDKALAALSASFGSSQELKPKDAVEYSALGSEAAAPWH